MALNRKERHKFMSHPFAMAIAQSMVMLRYTKIERPLADREYVMVQADPNLWKMFEQYVAFAFNCDPRFAECYPELTDQEAARAALAPGGTEIKPNA